MQITLLCVGKLKEPSLRALCAEYEKRLSRYHRLTVVEVADEPLPDDRPATVERALSREAARLTPHLQKGAAVALTIDGTAPDSLGFAAQMRGYETLGRPVVFVIGGSCGLHASVLAQCVDRLSLSRLTFPHNLARLLLLEQLYRAAKINAGETYHK